MIIRKCENVKGTKMGENEHKRIQYADDATICVRDKSSINTPVTLRVRPVGDHLRPPNSQLSSVVFKRSPTVLTWSLPILVVFGAIGDLAATIQS